MTDIKTQFTISKLFKGIKSTLSRNLSNAQGWRTDRKIIVIESDDWGSIRMPNKMVFNKLLKKNIRVDLCPYNKYDTLANVQDLSALFDILSKHYDSKNNHPIITFNTNVANPDFEKIKKEKWEKYYYEFFTDTLKRYYPNEDVFSMWLEGINNKLIFPQLHGREHVNADIWLNLIRGGNNHLKEAFDLNLYGLSFVTSSELKLPFLASLIYDSNEQKSFILNSIEEGSKIFEKIFDFKSQSFIAPLYTWSAELEFILFRSGIKYIQAGDKHMNYDFHKNQFSRTRHMLGSLNKWGQIYLNRNCTFEPTIHSNKDTIGDCLNQIGNSFLWKKPAVISMHRLNFIGAIDQNNRDQNLKKLDILLTKVKKKWKDIEFMHSSSLGDMISKDINHV